MQSLNDDEQQAVLGEVLSSQLQAIMEYVREIPDIKRELHQVHAVADDTRDRVAVIEQVVRGHEADIARLKQKSA